MPKIDELYAFVASDKDADDEGVVASLVGNRWIPLVGANVARVDQFRSLAQEVADAMGKPVLVLRFSGRELIETISPSRKA